MSDSVRELSRQTNLLLSRARSWTGSSWDVRIPTGETRAARLRTLIDELAMLGRQAGSGAPLGVRPPRVADHALPDQLIVLADDFLDAVTSADRSAAPGRKADLMGRALTAVSTARNDLDGPGFGFRPR
ncbi:MULTISPECIES: hypothetical protein [unclassified Parafrankia]|uniref:hypothetical protein n=1 Tax=unclassified Parafrankia TaxID=2994368 RepID=UPI000DA44CDD|nr:MULTISPECIES: hypothetical protein [unclassified Parafrankia]TCJ36851.1 hypothetical protein E0504_21470 [Parafrankia sp. BMG5.11]CAI7979352.1 conserved hypothetical protein [Frankia sp. Hr75.2]SQD96261.1 conserved hypothetical protein [Parafrankia sp. Ea1.12]